MLNELQNKDNTRGSEKPYNRMKSQKANTQIVELESLKLLNQKPKQTLHPHNDRSDKKEGPRFI